MFDQLNRFIQLPASPERIISLVPSQTELLFHLGLEEKVVGITKFCVHPELWFCSKTKVGGTKNIDIEKVRALMPDLIIANKEENNKEILEELMQEFPVWISDVTNVKNALEMIDAISNITNKKAEGKKLIDHIQNERLHLHATRPSHLKGKRVCYYIWKDPWMTVGDDTFIYDMLAETGLQPISKGQQRYPIIPPTDFEQIPDYIFLSTEPYPFKKEDLNNIQAMYPTSKVVIVDGEYFSWYGSRMKDSFKYINDLIAIL
ncbi:MAG TPA: helical backbone metal receptor [Bacteroidia bacterium]|nr:helical backbone metal receptor [Bacteroidia bacterium]